MSRLIFQDEEGQGAVEYAVLLAFMSLALIGTLAALGTGVGTAFSSIMGAI